MENAPDMDADQETTKLTFEDIPPLIIHKWQGIADLLADIMDLSAALIMKAEDECMEVVIASQGPSNPYRPGDQEKWHGLYCETVIKTREKLVVSNALKDPKWRNNPDIKRGMIAYMGFPVCFPDGSPYGTICVLDSKERRFTERETKLLNRFREMIESDLRSQALHTAAQRQNRLLQESEAKFRALVESTDDCIWELDNDERFMYVSPQVEAVLGYSSEEMRGNKMWDYMKPAEARRAREIILRSLALSQTSSYKMDNVYVRKNGSEVVMEVSGAIVVDGVGNPVGHWGISRDITRRKRDEEHRRMELNYLHIAVTTSAALTIATEDTEFDAVLNRALHDLGQLFAMDRSYIFLYDADDERMSNTHEWCAEGVEPTRHRNQNVRLETMPWWKTKMQTMKPFCVADVEGLPPEAAAEKKEFMHQGIRSLLCLPLLSGKGVVTGFLGFDAVRRSYVWPQDYIAMLQLVAGAIGGAIARRHAEARERDTAAQLQSAHRLESVGMLAAGIAHEINTPIQFVGDNIRFMKDAFVSLETLINTYRALIAKARQKEIREDAARAEEQADLDFALEEVPKSIEQSLDGIQRVAGIVSAMKDFSHPGSQEMKPIDLNHCVDTTVKVARNEWKYVAEIELDMDPALPLLLGHGGEINQVILNLVVNAAQAIAETGAGREQAKGRIHITTRTLDNQVELRVTDNGKGIPVKNRKNVFEPFFTTKEVGKGTGQGLSMSYQTIVKRHRGAITFETEEGRGTTFIVRLPVGGT